MSDQAQSPHGRLRESQLFLALTMIIGVLAGLMAVLFSLSIDVARHFLFGMDPTIATIIRSRPSSAPSPASCSRSTFRTRAAAACRRPKRSITCATASWSRGCRSGSS